MLPRQLTHLFYELEIVLCFDVLLFVMKLHYLCRICDTKNPIICFIQCIQAEFKVQNHSPLLANVVFASNWMKQACELKADLVRNQNKAITRCQKFRHCSFFHWISPYWCVSMKMKTWNLLCLHRVHDYRF